jgi:hypothetical protein
VFSITVTGSTREEHVERGQRHFPLQNERLRADEAGTTALFSMRKPEKAVPTQKLISRIVALTRALPRKQRSVNLKETNVVPQINT